MRVYFASNVVDPAEELFAYGGRNVLLSYAYIEDSFRPKALRTMDGFWLAKAEKRAERLRLYFAGNVKPSAADDAHRACYADGVRSRLQTFADVDDWAREGFAFWVERGEAPCASVFLDSGAFGAMTRGATIDLGRYCDYIRQYEHALACYASLDVIGDWRATARNLDAMLARGLRPVPTFHRGSPWEVLDELAAAHPYIALGGMVGIGGTRGTTDADSLRPHLDRCWEIVARHWPVKVHVFGIATQWVLERYPFYSADSASAIMGAGMGRVQRFGLNDHDVAPTVSGVVRSRGWPEDALEAWDGLVADGVGRTEGKSLSAHAGRRRRNIEAQLALERYLTDLWARRGVAWSEP